ncbi:MAG: hypothetical protein WCZ48_08200 [Bacillota bacterium]
MLIVQALVAIEAVQRRSRPEGVAVWQSAERTQIMIMPGSGEDHDQSDLRLICPGVLKNRWNPDLPVTTRR